jgi:hypothetical protein
MVPLSLVRIRALASAVPHNFQNMIGFSHWIERPLHMFFTIAILSLRSRETLYAVGFLSNTWYVTASHAL